MFCPRPATRNDVEALRHIDCSCFPTTDPQAVRARPGELRSAAENGCIILAEWDREPAGFLHVTATPQRIVLEALAVLPQFRRCGLARSLVQDVIRPLHGPERPFRLVETVTSPQNTAMVGLLTSLGFSSGELIRDHYGPGLHRLVFHWYSRPPLDIVASDPEVLSAVLRAGWRVTGSHLAADGTHLRLSTGLPDRPCPADPFDTPAIDLAKTQPTAEHYRLTLTDVPSSSTLGRLEKASTLHRRDSPCLRNADADWEYFNPVAYWKRNYEAMLPIDREILSEMSRYFMDLPPLASSEHGIRALDIGTGSNLYPALSILPLVDDITLADVSPANIGWLNGSLSDTAEPWPWQSFWQQVSQCAQQTVRAADYTPDRDVRRELRQRANPKLLSIFGLPQRTWDLGTMFFVAESITEDHGEFTQACASFFGALKPGAPFAAAFMTGSFGYRIDNTTFPAVEVGCDEIKAALAPSIDMSGLQVHEFHPLAGDVVRDHTDQNTFTSMVLALGRVR